MNARPDLARFLAAPARSTTAPYQLPPSGPLWLFEAGLPDPATFPSAHLARIASQLLDDESHAALQYGGGAANEVGCGYIGLRDSLARRAFEREGLDLDRDSIMLTAGAAQGLMLAFEALVDPGDAVAVEAPTWNAILAALDRRQADVLSLPLDHDGLRIDALEGELRRLAQANRRLKFVYTIANFNTPTGVCLSIERRRQLLALAAEWDFLVIEDNVYERLRYEGHDLPSLLSLDSNGRVIRVDSFSKVVAPGLRLGWVTAPPDIILALAAVRGDLGASQFTARVVDRYLGEGLLDSHLATIIDTYRIKRDATEAALHAHCDPWVTWRTPQGGFFLWVQLDDAIDPSETMRRALEGGVLCRAGERFFDDRGQGHQYFRLAFPGPALDEIERGVAVLGDAMRASKRS